MKSFQVFEHPTLGYKAVKNGFSWPAFFFTWIWAFVKKMWGEGAIIIVVMILVSSIVSLSVLLTVILELSYGIFIGSRGNDWYKRNLNKRGFKVLDTLNAESCEAAIAVIDLQKKQTAIKNSDDTKTDDHEKSGNEHLFLQAYKEFEQNDIDEALWIKLLTLSDGDEKKAKFEFIKHRVNQLQTNKTNKIKEIKKEPTVTQPVISDTDNVVAKALVDDSLPSCPFCNEKYQGDLVGEDCPACGGTIYE